MRCSKSVVLVISTVLTMLGTTNSHADDTEIFFGNTTAGSSTSDPNILLVLDTSGSMGYNVTSRKDYDPKGSYSASSCSDTNVYYAVAGDPIPTCGSSQKIPTTSFYCTPATASFAASGFYQGNGIQWVKSKKGGTTRYQWQTTFYPSSTSSTTYTSTDVTCQDNNTSGQYPVAGNSSTNEWAGSSTSNYWTSTTNKAVSYVFYSANYIRYWNDSSQITTESRLKTVQTAAKNLIASVSNVNVGLARYNAGGNGGMIVVPVAPLSTNSSTLNTAIDDLHNSNDTPLSETLYEAYLYMAGKDVKYGLDSHACQVDSLNANCASSKIYSLPSTATSRTDTSVDVITSKPKGTTYKTPITTACQKNYIVYLTDGLPKNDDDADSLISGLGVNCYSDKSTMWDSFGVSSPPADSTTNGGLCMKALINYMYNNDLNNTDLKDGTSPLAGTQNVTTDLIGFGSDVEGGDAFKYLDDAAKGGGGQAYTANDLSSLTSTLTKIVGAIQKTSATFTAPSVAVNAFNKTQILEDLYISMFSPSLNYHWPGNAKKFKLRPNSTSGVTEIVDQTYVNAVDPSTGFLNSTAKDFWENTAPLATDDITTRGGAAKNIPDPGSRNLYTYLGSNSDLSDSTNAVSTANITSLESKGLPTTGTSLPTSTKLVNWMRGMDVDDDNSDGDTTDAREVMGDPIHSQPAVVIYGSGSSSSSSSSSSSGTTVDELNDAVVYVSTNDGYLHAFDALTGVEKWAFIPQEFLGNMLNLYQNSSATTKHYMLDGNIRVLRYDTNNDGKIDPTDNDRVFLYFSDGRGGDRYYALDVTYKNDSTKTKPKFLWSLGTADLKKNSAAADIVKYSWSTPTLGRINIGGATQNPQKLVLIFAGGYDPVEDLQGYQTSDSYGNGIFIVDAITGKLLWSQTKDSGSTSFKKMDHAIPSAVTVLDTDLDGFTDRMYVGDMAGQIWRFDITNGNSASDTTNPLVAGGVIASLGGKEDTASIANNRSFYNPPNVAKIISYGGANYYNIAIGSGDDALPKSNVTTQDRFYSLRDYNLSPMTQAQYDAYTPIVEGDLTTTTAVTKPTTIKPAGWKIDLSTAEKVLAASITINGVVTFTTYIPGASSTGCSVTSGTARAYNLNIATADKHFSDNSGSSGTPATAYDDSFNTTGLPSQVTDISNVSIVRTDGTTGTTSSTGCTAFSGVTILGHCVDYGSKIKTVWKENGIN